MSFFLVKVQVLRKTRLSFSPNPGRPTFKILIIKSQLCPSLFRTMCKILVSQPNHYIHICFFKCFLDFYIYILYIYLQFFIVRSFYLSIFQDILDLSIKIVLFIGSPILRLIPIFNQIRILA